MRVQAGQGHLRFGRYFWRVTSRTSHLLLRLHQLLQERLGELLRLQQVRHFVLDRGSLIHLFVDLVSRGALVLLRRAKNIGLPFLDRQDWTLRLLEAALHATLLRAIRYSSDRRIVHVWLLPAT